MKRILKSLLRDLLILAGFIICASGLVAWWQVRHAEDAQMRARAQETLVRLAGEIRIELRPAERVGAVAARWWAEGAIPLGALPEGEPRLKALLEAFPEVSGLTLVSSEGWGLSLARSPKGMESHHLDARQQNARRRPLRIEGLPVPPADWEMVDPHPFRSPWYTLAQTWRHARWLEVGAPLQDPPRLSYTLPLLGPGGEFRGALRADLPLGILQERLGSPLPTPNAQAFLTDGQGRMVLPASPEVPGQPQALLAAWERSGRSSEPRRVSLDGKPHLGASLPVNGLDGLPWVLSLAIPIQDFRTPLPSLTLGALGLGLLASALGIWQVRRLARRLRDPLKALGESAEQLAHGQPPAPVVSEFEEVQGLSDALQRAGQSLEEEAEVQLEVQQGQRLELLGTLAGGLAQDVANQLAGIVGQLNLGREFLDPDHPAYLRLVRAEEQAQACDRTIGTLLAFARKGGGERNPTNLNRLIQHTAPLLERLLGDRIRLELELVTHLRDVPVDPVGFEQALLNLALNARDAMPLGGTLRIATGETEEGTAWVEVKDEGTGIAPEILDRIFDPFFTTKDPDQGSGLGLAIVASIVRAHRGRIEVESRLGEGSTFRILLGDPLRDGSGLEPARTGTEPVPPGFQGRRVLVVDDEAALRELMVEGFEARGAQVRGAVDGEEAWEAFQEGPWDLVVSDQRMPRLTGLELLERIRRSGSTLPVILISGFGLEGAQEIATTDPALRLIPKPFAFKTLFAEAQGLLNPPAGD